MAIRINITAVRDGPPEEIRAVMTEAIRAPCAGPQCSPVGEQLDGRSHGGWAWFATSGWGGGAVWLKRGRCKLGRPALQFPPSDGDRWSLRSTAGQRGRPISATNSAPI